MTAPKGYSVTQIALHWVVAVLIVCQLIFGEEIGSAFRTLRQTGVANYDLMTLGHIGAGILVLVFAVWRLVLRLKRGVPEPSHVGPKAFERAAVLGHWAFYVLMVMVPVTGLVAWFGGGIETAAEAHELAKPVFIILIAVHVLAALWHHFWLQDGLLNRMRRSAN
jgi:cytochrome b561